MKKDISKLDPKEYILIKGAKLHNLKNIDLAIPKNKLVVITGMSGSGKSTLAFDTLYAEGQRRYVESLSSYARQFLGKLDKPQVDYIHGIAPAIAIQQKVNSTNPRSTVGTSTEIYDYLKLLYARIGKTFSPVTGELVKKDSVSDVIDFIKTYPFDTKFILAINLDIPEDRTFTEHLNILQQIGFTRLAIDGNQVKIEDLISFNFEPQPENKITLIIDRISVSEDAQDSFFHRLADSIETAFFEGKGNIELEIVDEKIVKTFSNKFEADGIVFNEPNTHFFSFNNPYGACPTCEGYGKVIGIDEDLVVPNKALSIYEDAIVAWKGEKMSEWKMHFMRLAPDFPIHKPYYELSDEQKDFLWRGAAEWEGLDGFFKMVEQNTYKIQYRVMLSRYRGKTTCPTCRGKRLRKETDYVRINDKSISQLVDLPLNELNDFFQSIEFSEFDHQVANRIIYEIGSRLQFLLDVGLEYLTLNRASNTLSGGESQRINLATSLGSSLVGSMYILDEPSIGLHSKDTERFVTILHRLRDLGNTVIVVEHDEDIMKAADYIIDIGPEAGTNGGEIVFEGTYDELLKADTLTANYLNGKLVIEVPSVRRKPKNYLKVLGARENNLKNIDVKFPLNMFTVITGVSGSGKSTLMKNILTPALERHFEIFGNRIGEHDGLIGDLNTLKGIELIDQNPIGKSTRSNPVTYVKAYDDIRNLFASQKASKLNGFQAKHFSFNVDGGRCDTCKGEGTITIEMQFMADVDLICEECHGERFKKSVLEVKYEGLSISDVLNLTIDDAIDFFTTHNQKKIVDKIKPLQDVGLGYVKLGQSSSTLSGGEAQRVKLAFFLTKGEVAEKTLFIFDEPSTGLHFHDIQKLIKALQALIDLGHSVFVIEHNVDIIKVADWVIDLGPEGGKNGGYLVAEGTPEQVAKIDESFTGIFLKEKLN